MMPLTKSVSKNPFRVGMIKTSYVAKDEPADDPR